MRHKSSLEYREAVNNKTTVMANPFQTKASKLHDFNQETAEYQSFLDATASLDLALPVSKWIFVSIFCQ